MSNENEKFLNEGDEAVNEETKWSKFKKTVKENKGALVFMIIGGLFGAGMMRESKNKEINKIKSINNELIDNAYDRGRIDGTMDTYEKIIITKTIE